MKMLNQVKMTFASRSVNESFSRAALAAFLAQADPTVPQLADIKTAVSEAVTNCIVHAYPDTVGPITMTAVFCMRAAMCALPYRIKALVSRTLPRQWSQCIPPATRTSARAWGLR